MSAEQIREQNVFPKGFYPLPHPKHSAGGFVFPQRAGPEGIPDFLNQPALDYTGLSLDQAETGWPRAFHPDDKKRMLET
jgi:hypothetical protein